MKDIDDVLFEALSPQMEPKKELDQRIIDMYKEDQIMNIKDIRRKRFPVAAAVAAAIILASSATAFAAIHYLSSRQVAHELGDNKLETAFESQDAVSLDEVQEIDGYNISLRGMISGKDLSDSKIEAKEGEFRDDRTYVVVAIQKANGDELGEDSFFTSPLISGYDQREINIATLLGGYKAFYSDDMSVWYEIVDMDNLEPFSNHKIYLAVQNGGFFENDTEGEPAYIYDESTGEYSKNSRFKGVNALFVLPIDASKADEERAEKIIQKINNSNDSSKEKDESLKDMAVDKFMEQLNPEKINEYALPVNSTRQTLTPDSNGSFSWSYEMPDGEQGKGTESISNLFPENHPGMCKDFSYSYADKDIKDLRIHTFTLNEDGSVTFVIYVPKDK